MLLLRESKNMVRKTFDRSREYQSATIPKTLAKVCTLSTDILTCRLGKLLLGYGNVKAAENKLDESLELHERCLAQYKASIGPYHHRTGDACVHVADHYKRLHRFSEALALLDQADVIYHGRSHFRPEDARVCFKRSKILLALDEQDKARACGNEAWRLYRLLHPNDTRRLGQLADADFDRSIMFWSR